MDGASVALSAASAILGVGVAWGTFRTKIASLEKLVQKHETKIDEHIDKIHELELKEAEARANIKSLEGSNSDRAADFDQLKASVVNRDLFQSETRAQNRRLDDIRSLLSRTPTPSSGFRRPDSREESEPPLPPPRPRLPSRGGGE